MPDITLQFTKGVLKDVDATELSSPEFAPESRNLLITEAGSLKGRPGLLPFSSIGSYGVIGLKYFNGMVFAVTADRRMYSISEQGAVSNVTGAVLEGTSRPVFETDPSFLAIAGGGEPRTWSGSGDTVAMAGTPIDTTHIAFLDGYWLLNKLDDQEIHWAGPTAAARLVWDANNFFSAERYSDKATALGVLNREFWVWGPKSTECFQNLGDSVVPFRPAFALERGIGAIHSTVIADNTFWILDNERHFVQYQGKTPVNISTPKIDKFLRGLGTVSDCWGSRIDIGGNFLICWTFPSAEKSFVYDYRRQDWHEWDGFRFGLSDRFRAHSHLYVEAWNKHLVGDFRAGMIWELSDAAFSDGDQPRRILRRTGYLDHGTGHRKRNKSYLFHVKRGVGTGSIEPVFTVRFRDDGGQWGQPRTIGLGLTGDNNHTAKIVNTGIYRKRQIEITMTDAAEFLLTKVEEDVEPLNS